MGKYIFSFYLLIVVSVSSAQEYNPDSVRGMVNKAAQLQKEGEYVEALIGFERALFIADSIKDNKSIYDCIVNLGSLFYEWNDIQKAKIYYKKAVDIALIIEDKKILAGAYNNIGVIVSEENSWDSSLIYYQKAKSLYEELNDSAYLAGTINNIGNVYTYKEDFEKSISYYKKAYKIMSLVDRESDAAVFALNVAGSYRTIGQADSALLYLNIGDKIARGLNSILLDIKVAGSFAHFYENSEDYEIANKYIKEYYNLNDSLFSLEKQKQIVSLQEKYKTEKQKTTIDLLKKEKEIDQIKLNRQNLFIYSITFVIILLLLLLLLVVRQNRLKTKFLKNEKEKNLADKKLQHSKNQLLIDRIQHQERELVSSTMHVLQKNQLLQKLKTEIDSINKEVDNKELYAFSREMKGLISQTGVWESFKYHFENVHPEFFVQLKKEFPKLTQNDFKLSAYIKIGLSNKEIASLMQIAPESVKSAKKRLKKKMNINPEERLQDMIINT